MSSIVGFVGSKNAVISSSGGTGALTRKGGSIDYEEGTWTPTSQVGTLTTSGFSWYRKIGNMVWIGTSVTFSSSASGSAQYIQGVPFTSGASSYAGCTIGYTDWTSTHPASLTCVVWATGGPVHFYNNNSALTAANLSGSRVDFTIHMTIS